MNESGLNNRIILLGTKICVSILNGLTSCNFYLLIINPICMGVCMYVYKLDVGPHPFDEDDGSPRIILDMV